jgi:cell wall-associated NlpC family hydrolase
MSGRFPSNAAVAGAMALSVFSAACASTVSAPRPFPMPAPPVARRPAAPADGAPRPAGPENPVHADAVVRAAMDLRGAPYRNGGSDPRGFDCSGFTQYVFAQAGTGLPRETREQFLLGAPVSPGDQQPGDLLFFTTTAPGASHVGIALGHDQFVHAPSSRGVVRVESLTLPYWSGRLIGVRRIGGS